MNVFSKIFIFFSLLGISLIGPTVRHVMAVGTPAGTLISNQASVTFSIGSDGPYSMNSNIVNTPVEERIDLNLSWQNAAAIEVIPGDINQYQTLLLTNTGNGSETFIVSANWAISGDQFDPQPVGVFADTNDNGQYDPGTDTILANGEVLLNYDQSLRIFIVSNIPETRHDGTSVQDRDNGLVEVSVSNSHGPGDAGLVFPGQGDSGTTAIYATSFPVSRVNTYIIKAIYIDIAKTSTVTDQFDGDIPYPGATVAYQLVVTATGSGTAHDFVINDLIPDNTSYKAGSLNLDGEPLTDEADDDAGEASGDPVEQINVELGDQTEGERIITFDVTIDE